MDLTSEQRMTESDTENQSLLTCAPVMLGEEVAWACATSCSAESLKALLPR